MSQKNICSKTVGWLVDFFPIFKVLPSAELLPGKSQDAFVVFRQTRSPLKCGWILSKRLDVDWLISSLARKVFLSHIIMDAQLYLSGVCFWEVWNSLKLFHSRKAFLLPWKTFSDFKAPSHRLDTQVSWKGSAHRAPYDTPHLCKLPRVGTFPFFTRSYLLGEKGKFYRAIFLYICVSFCFSFWKSGYWGVVYMQYDCISHFRAYFIS